MSGDYYNVLYVDFYVGLMGDVVIDRFRDSCNHHSTLAESEVLAREMGSEVFLTMLLGTQPGNVLAKGRWRATSALAREGEKLVYNRGRVIGRPDD